MDVRVAWGTGPGPTELAAYDAALGAAGVGNYNLVTVSSVLPAAAAVSVAGTAPDLGPAGARLTVVQARATTAGPRSVAAALGWASGPGPGIVYEAAGPAEEASVREDVADGLAAGRSQRDWTFENQRVESVAVDAPDDGHAAAVVVATLGTADPFESATQ
jgi:arginine decarboxylase